MIKATYYWACPRQPRVGVGGQAYLFKACFNFNQVHKCKKVRLQREKNIFAQLLYQKLN
jgi:hypothetical protein